MEKEPGDRPQSARELVKALDDSALMRVPLAKWKIGALVAIVLLLLAAAIMLRQPIADWVRRVSGAGDDSPAISTLAARPFANNSGNPQAEYFLKTAYPGAS
jgi:hypothetical protein